MKVFEISTLNDIQLPEEDSAVFLRELHNFDCVRMIDRWNPPPFYVRNPKLEFTPFFCYDSVFGFYSEVLKDEIMEALLIKAGEWLPINVEGRPAYIVNVIECCNCLNVDGSKWFVDP